MKEMIEVKTSNNNYKMGKTTINARMNEDSEPTKPIVTAPQRKSSQENQSPKKHDVISDDRLEEIKIEHYNRKMASTHNDQRQYEIMNQHSHVKPASKQEQIGQKRFSQTNNGRTAVQ